MNPRHWRRARRSGERGCGGGIAWLNGHAIEDVAIAGGRDTPEGRHLVARKGARPLWARYGLDSEKPVFGDRDKTIGDAWFNVAPAAAIEGYGEWVKA
ncbi:MAG TPA: pectate lyase [Acidobacteriaceae bacterium]|jgi:PelA/Pel-15E family pectate lyase|nr:pectate lyase [Acidobacteriaceae bacterium]